MADLNSSEFIQATLASFDSKIKTFSFRRTFPALVYVSGDAQATEIGRALSAIVREALSELDFEVEEFRTEVGSFCQLNLCSSRVPIDEKTLREKITTAHSIVRERLADLPLDRVDSVATVGGSAVAAVVAIGNVAQAIAAHGALTVGTFRVPAMIWVPLLVAKYGREVIKETVKIFVESKDARKAIKDANSDISQVEVARLPRPDKDISKPIADSDEKIRQLEERVRELQDDINRLKER
jgi:hypothetical protein